MALTISVADVGPYSITYKCDEAATAVSAVTQDILANLTANGVGAGFPLFDYLSTTVANANDADDLIAKRVDCLSRTRTASAIATQIVAGGNSGTGVGAFRLVINTLKTANGTTAEFYLTVRLRHSIIAQP